MGTVDGGNGNNKKPPDSWPRRKEIILFFLGITIVVAEFIESEIRHGTFHFEYLIAGLAACGISIAQWGDRK